MNRTQHVAVFAMLLVAVLSGCTTGGAPSSEPTPAAPEPQVETTDPIDLVNMWRVTEAQGTGPDSWLRLAGRDLLAWTDCGIAGGDWRASGGLFVASINSAIGEQTCLGETGLLAASLEWLFAATSFVESREGFDLLDRDGEVVAHLEVDGNPPTQSDVFLDEYTLAPEVTDDVRALFPAPVALPEDATPTTVTDLQGRWQPLALGDGDPPYVEFNDDGTWNGSDGCNGMAGRWRLGDDGHFLATGGFSTLMGCFNSPAPSWVGGTSLIGMVGDELVLFDASGAELGSLVRP